MKTIFLDYQCSEPVIEENTGLLNYKQDERDPKMNSTKNLSNGSVKKGDGCEPQKKMYKCTECNKQLIGSFNYRKHLKQRHGKYSSCFSNEAVKCPVCKVILQWNNLKIHLNHYHQTSLVKLRPFSCAKCNRLFLRYANLINHEKREHDEVNQFTPQISVVKYIKEKRTVCSKCGKLFSTVNRLMKHECFVNYQAGNPNAAHKCQKQKSFKCSYCNAGFTMESNKIRHVRKFHGKQIAVNQHKSQTRRLRRKCEVQSNSTVIRRTPGGVKIIYADNLFCSYCPKVFSFTHTKALHEKIHTGDRPHQCKHCETSFRLAHSHSNHEKKCHDIHDMLWCEYCDFYSKFRPGLEMHYQNMHGFNLNEYEDFLRQKNRSSDALQNDALQNDATEEKLDDDNEDIWSEFILIDDD